MQKPLFLISLTLTFMLIILSCEKENTNSPSNNTNDDTTSSVDTTDDESFNTDTSGTFTDSRDNTVYKWIKIGDQIWMAENLRATHYSDGTPIPLVTDDTEWANLEDNNTDKAYCWYDNDSATNASTYGALYTWAAAMNGAPSDTNNPSGVQGVCPSGWHLPSDAEWKELEMALGMSQAEADNTGFRGTNEGSKLAGNADLWSDGALESDADFGISGFSALPGGFRSNYNGSFDYAGDYGDWWCSTVTSASNAWSRNMYYNYADVNRNSNNKSYGFSVRCVRD